MSELLKPFYNPGPGDVIKDAMEELGWNQQDLAEILGMTLKSINLILNNKQSITPETAKLLGVVFKTSADLWMNLEAAFQLRKVSETKDDRYELAKVKSEISRLMPLSEVRQKKWTIYDTSKINGIKSEMERVFGTSRYLEITESIQNNRFYARRTGFDYDYSYYYCNAWYRYAKLLGCNQNLPQYNMKKLEELSRSLYQFTSMVDGISKFISRLRECGVGFFVLSHLKKTYLDGATFISDGSPYIVFTGRHDRIDNFWFVIAHEISHILLHFDKLDRPCLDNLEQRSDEEIEVEADSKASEMLKADRIISLAKPFTQYFSETRLLWISEETGVSPALVAGILQHNKLIDYRKFAKYKTTVLNQIDQKWIIG